MPRVLLLMVKVNTLNQRSVPGLVEPQRSVQSLDKKPVITYINYIIVNSYS